MIAKDKYVTLRNDHIAIIGPGRTTRGAVLDVILGQKLSVDEDVAVSKGDLFTGQPDDSLDVGLVRAGRWIENDDIAALRGIKWVVPIVTDVGKRIGVSVHKEHFPIVEIWQHAFTVDTEIEHHEPDQEKDERGKQECLDDLSYRPARLMLGARRRLGALLYEDGICRSVLVQDRCEIAFWCHRCPEALATRVAPAQQEERGGLPRSWRRNRILLAGVRLDLVGANLGALSGLSTVERIAASRRSGREAVSCTG